MCVLQDFEALTPNLLARTIETVQGGGLVVLLLNSMTSLKQLYTMTMDVHSRYRSEGQHDPVARFNERFLLSLAGCETCLVVDDHLNVLPISSKNLDIQPVPKRETVEGLLTAEQIQLESLKKELMKDEKSKGLSALVDLAKTLDQAQVVSSMNDLLASAEGTSGKTIRTTVSLTASRGRGKSAALGLSLAAAISQG